MHTVTPNIVALWHKTYTTRYRVSAMRGEDTVCTILHAIIVHDVMRWACFGSHGITMWWLGCVDAGVRSVGGTVTAVREHSEAHAR